MMMCEPELIEQDQWLADLLTPVSQPPRTAGT